MTALEPGLKRILLITLGLKLFSYGLILWTYHFLPFNLNGYWHNFHYPADAPPSWLSAFKTWDAQCYLYLAGHGYGPPAEPDAFFPLFPFLISQAKFLFLGHALFTGLVLSLLLTLVSVFYLYRLVKDGWGETAAFRACLALLAFPTAFYMGLVYTESLFLALALCFFYSFRRDQLGLAAFCAFLLPLTRPTGALMLAPVLVDLWKERRRWPEPVFRRKCLVPLGFLAGTLFFFFLMRMTTGDFFTYSKTQVIFFSHYSASNLLNPFHWFWANFIANHWTFHGFETSAMNRLCFVLVVAALALSFRTLDFGLWTYAFFVGLALGMVGDLMSFPRYALAAFPLFIWAAVKWGDRLFYYWAPSFLLQALLLMVHASNNWVA
ncbi:MAG TPA: hypothetical protein VMU88_04920 [bacterium]|nr:hypothetical protein [bacterium]